MNWRRIVWLLALVTLPTLAEETPLQLVLRGAQHDQLYQLSSSGVTKVSALPDSLTTPLGSLWKLYVYAWLEDTHQPEQPYQCRGNSPEEVYCCQAGESITRDTALVRSCGLYFAPQRLHIGADVWGQYWQQRQAPAWLASLPTLKPETSVTVKSLLDSLATLPAQNKAQEVLLDVVLDEAKKPYQCRGNSPEEVYCCQAGESITRDTALVRSCGLYFAPQRLHIGADVWGQYWQQRQAPAWLASLPTLKPETSVTVKSLLDSLATLPAQNKAQEVLLDVVLDEAKIGVASMLGSRVRVKTWSWFADDKQEIRQGGFAGWLTDGTPLWVTGSGTSKTVLTRYATVLNRVLPVPTQVASGQCVEVELFARYPLKKITAEKSTTAVKPGVLNGRYRVTFTNGNHITFVSHGETTLLSEKGKLKLQSHLDREEYVARVLDREAKSTPPEAAKAMTVAIRTFLQQNANREGDCLTIPDSSATQRVSASPATTGARTMTAWTQDLIYAGDPVHYHGSRATEGTLSWRQATAQAGQGERYDQILAFAYPDNSLSRWGAPRSTCQLLPKAKAWLAKKMPQWRRILQGETGYNEPDVFAVCRLVSGFPYTDRQQKRLFIRNFFTLQDRLDLTHEYLHLAFDGYPTGLDENYIETLTRQLLMD